MLKKMILSITVKITEFQVRISESSNNIGILVAEIVNKKLKEQNKDKRVISQDRFLEVSEKAHDKILKIYQEDMKF